MNKLELLEIASQIDQMAGRFFEMSTTQDTINGVRALTMRVETLKEFSGFMRVWSARIRHTVFQKDENEPELIPELPPSDEGELLEKKN